MRDWEAFREVWVLDFEFHAPPGEPPEPLCLVAREVRTGRQRTRVPDIQPGLHRTSCLVHEVNLPIQSMRQNRD